MAGVTVKLDGLKELEAALAEFKVATARNIVRRALITAAEPIAERARQLVPVATGKLRDSIGVDSGFTNRAGKAAYAGAMKAGASKAEAVTALRDAQREAGGSSVVVAVGPGPLPYANLVEFGSAPHTIRPRKKGGKTRLFFQEDGQFREPVEVQHPGAAPHPYLRPAWEGGKAAALDSVRDQIALEIDKAAKRAASKAARLAAKG